MRVRSARIKNYKSIGKEQKIFFNDRVAVIIGKNESGKTNILDLFTDINLLSGAKDNVKRKKNMQFEDDSFNMLIEVELDKDELEELELDNPYSSFKISDEFNNYCEVSGGVSVYFSSDKFLLYMTHLEEFITEFVQATNDNSIRALANDVQLYFKDFNIKTKPYYELKLNSIGNYIRSKVEYKDKWEELSSVILKYIDMMYRKFPVFHKVTNFEFQSAYTMTSDFYAKNTGSDVAITSLIEATKIPKEIWERATYKMPASPQEQNAQGKIRKAIEDLSAEFNSYFGFHNSIIIEPQFSYSKFRLFVKSNELYSIPLDERSQGLKWYFNLFLEIKTYDLLDKNVLLLIDEPGVHLHVIAQKEVLEMFDKFSTNKIRIVYTTHSPYMIDENKIYRVIATHKTEDDNTIISSSLSSDNLNPTSKIDTLTPLIEAIGTKLKYNIGFPFKQKYIVTEGITDAIYLNKFLAYFKQESYQAIPSKGASNVCHMCLLLFGLGFNNFIALFDNDKGGRSGSESLVNSFVKGQEQTVINEFKLEHTKFLNSVHSEFNVIEDLICENEVSMGGVNVSKDSKAIFCTTFCQILDTTPEKISNKTIENFKDLIESIS